MPEASEPEQESEKPVRHKEQSDIAYFYSWPLVAYLTGTPSALERLSYEDEYSRLLDGLDKVKKNVRIRKNTATKDNFMTETTLGCRVIHYSGHGLKNGLAFEGDTGKMDIASSENLRDMVTAGGTSTRIQLVVLTACMSEETGNAFAEAGIPHVVAVHVNGKVEDTAAKKFICMFYLSIFSDLTVKQSFERAKVAVEGAARVGANQANLFLLLPADKEHDEILFQDLPEGSLEDQTPRMSPCQVGFCPSIIEARQPQMQEVVQFVTTAISKKIGVVTIIGPLGIGKTTMARAVAKYMHERYHFLAGTFLIELKDVGPKMSVTRLLSTMLANNRIAGIEPCDDSRTLCNQLRAIQTERLRNKLFLFVLDGVKPCHQGGDAATNVRELVNNLLACTNVRVLLTGREGLGGLIAQEVKVTLEKLTPLVAAQFFHDSCHRLEKSEYKCRDDFRAREVLSRHKALRLCNGVPVLLFKVAQLRTPTLQLDGVVPLIGALLEEYEAEARGSVEPVETKRIEQTTQQQQHQSVGGEGREFSMFWQQSIGGGDRVAFPKLAMKLQARFQMQTRGRTAQTRNLSAKDMALLQTKLEVDGAVPKQRLEKLWSHWRFFEKVVPQIQALWAYPTTLIHGLMSSKDAEALLQGYQIGVFILRFATTQPCMAVTFTASDGRTGHVRIQQVLIYYDSQSGRADPWSYYMGRDKSTIRRFPSLQALIEGTPRLMLFYAHPDPLDKNTVFSLA